MRMASTPLSANVGEFKGGGEGWSRFLDKYETYQEATKLKVVLSGVHRGRETRAE